MTDEIIDNRAAGSFELAVGDQTVFALYRREGARLLIRHVEAPPNLRGTGVASRLMAGIMELAAREGLRVVPLCSYAAAWLRKNRAE
jgi:predicted GNAT family acetyltransferase